MGPVKKVTPAEAEKIRILKTAIVDSSQDPKQTEAQFAAVETMDQLRERIMVLPLPARVAARALAHKRLDERYPPALKRKP